MKVQRAGRNFTVDVAADGEGLISHAGAALLGEVADRVGLTKELSARWPGCVSAAGVMTPVASDSTAFRLIDRIAGAILHCLTRCVRRAWPPGSACGISG